MAVNLDDDMEDLSLGQLGSAGGIGTSSASRARMLAIEREKQMKKRNNSAQLGKYMKHLLKCVFKMTCTLFIEGMVRSSKDSTSDNVVQSTPAVRQFSAPRTVTQNE
jgi:hypothetical protein